MMKIDGDAQITRVPNFLSFDIWFAIAFPFLDEIFSQENGIVPQCIEIEIIYTDGAENQTDVVCHNSSSNKISSQWFDSPTNKVISSMYACM